MASHYKIKALEGILQEELSGNKARMTLLSYLVISLLKTRSVNFKRLATGYHNGAQLSSKLRWIQRFFRQFDHKPPKPNVYVFSFAQKIITHLLEYQTLLAFLSHLFVVKISLNHLGFVSTIYEQIIEVNSNLLQRCDK
ncbi:MAG: hypothetical protein KTR26_21200 [Flammeovirgaceae bacterium]|nr:hypothetical protein [Flammeovirgaceae bacterium]